MRSLLIAFLALSLASSARADEDDQTPDARTGESGGHGIAISKALSEISARPLTVNDKPPTPTRSSSSRRAGGGPRHRPLGAVRPEPEGPATPAQPDPKCPEGHAACTRKANVALYEPFADHREYNYVARDASCWEAALVFIKWQLWHFRRMNRVADNSNGCPGVPLPEQAKILAVQARNKATFDKMVALESQGVENTCDQIVQAYRDTLLWSELALFFKGRYMTRCRAAWDVAGHADPWLHLTACPAEIKAQYPHAQCSPPLPGN